MKKIQQASKLDKQYFGWHIPGSRTDCNRVITQYTLLDSDNKPLSSAFVKNLQFEEKAPRYILRGTLLPRPGSKDNDGNPIPPLQNFVCEFTNYALDMGDKDCADSWTRGLWIQGEETVGKQKKTYWYKLERPSPVFSTQGADMDERLDKFFALHRVLSLYKPDGYATMVQCELTIEELHENHPNSFDLNDLANPDFADFFLDNLGRQVSAKESAILIESIGRLAKLKEKKILGPFTLTKSQFEKYLSDSKRKKKQAKVSGGSRADGSSNTAAVAKKEQDPSPRAAKQEKVASKKGGGSSTDASQTVVAVPASAASASAIEAVTVDVATTAAAGTSSAVVSSSSDPGTQDDEVQQETQGKGQRQRQRQGTGNGLVSERTEPSPQLPPQRHTLPASATDTTSTSSINGLTVAKTDISLPSDSPQSNNTTNGSSKTEKKRKRQENADSKHDADAVHTCIDGECDEDEDKVGVVGAPSKHMKTERGREGCARTKGDIDMANKMWKTEYLELSSSKDKEPKIKWSPPTTHRYDPHEHDDK